MNAPWALANKIEEDDDSSIRLTTATWSDRSLEFQLEISTLDADEKVWQLRCDDVLEHNLKSWIASSLELTDDHPLLWKFRYDSASAYFNGIPQNVLAAVGSLYEAHRRAVGEWFSLDVCVNRQIVTSELLQTGSGLLAQGPVPLLVVYKEALKSHGIVVEILSPYPPSGRMSSLALQNKLRNESKVLLIGDSFISGIGWTATEMDV